MLCKSCIFAASFYKHFVWQRYKLEKEQKEINEMIKAEEEKHKQYQDEIQALKTDKSKIEKIISNLGVSTAGQFSVLRRGSFCKVS